MSPIVVFILLLKIICTKTSRNLEYRVGGLFNDVVNQVAFQLVINDLNDKNWKESSSFQLIAEPYNVSYVNSFETRKAACALLNRGVIGIFGPSSVYTSNYIQSLCDVKEIPHLETHEDLKLKENKNVVNLYPSTNALAEFFVQLIQEYKWNRVIILFEENDSLLRFAPLLDLNILYGIHLVFRQLNMDSSGSYREVLNNIKKIPDTNILLDCSTDILEEVLKQAQQVGIITEGYNYIISNLDMGTLDLEPFQYGGANITGIRVFNPNDDKIIKIKELLIKMANVPEEKQNKWNIRLSTALLIDATELFYDVIKQIVKLQGHIQVQNLNCKFSDSWNYGYTIANQIRGSEYKGITGKIKFDLKGIRSDFDVELLELTATGLEKIGEWNSLTKRLDIKRKNYFKSDDEDAESNLFNKTYKVITALTAPYAMLKETTDQLTGNDQYEGYCIDVIQELSQILGFNYTIMIQEDGANGNFNRSTNQWNGIIKEIINGRADLGIADLTITSERENAVDFTEPFMNLGISILYKKPEPVPPSLFMFTSPFSTAVWIMLGVAYLLVSISIFIMGRLSPSEWTNPYPCVEEPDYLINQFSMRNSLWFTIGGLLAQGSDIAPISISTRTASGFWWFFVLIMVSSYTANLAAFLTVETLVTPFKNIDELSKQKDIKYGAKKGGATENFFRDSNVTTYKKVWNYLKENPDVLTDENEQGVRRVETENYAYLMESTTIEYTTQRHCSLAQVGPLLDDKGYGIAMKKYSPFRNDLSTAVLKLQETGILTKLKIKWWKEKRGGSTCATKSEGSEAEALDLQNVGGVFLVLFVGAILGLLGSFMEMIFETYQRSSGANLSFYQQLKQEINFIVQFNSNFKEVARTDK